MPRRRWVVRALVAVVAVAAVGFLFRNTLLGPTVDVYEVRRGDLTQTVVATGRVTTPQRVAIGTVITERVVRIPVEEGQAVRRGDVLLALDDKDERAALAQAEAAVAQAEARLSQIRDTALRAAEQALAQAEANRVLAGQQYQRNQDLAAKNFISRSALDDAKRNVDVAESQLAAARLQVESNRPGGSETRVAVTALAQARAALGAARARLEDTLVRAPVDGVLIGRSVEPGDVVQPGRELMALAPSGEMQIVVQVDERNLARLAPGQKALVSADAFPRERFAAELFYINPGIDALRGAVEVKLRVPDPPAYLRQDMTVSVDIESAKRNGVLVAPAVAVFDGASAEPWVLVVDANRVVRTPVTLGLRGDGSVEIASGVAEGARLVASTAGVVPGDRVRVGAVVNAGTR
ncbi:MAG: efflux RND transporter periplasmic adaptor subunit [Burkholderiales bacterium]